MDDDGRSFQFWFSPTNGTSSLINETAGEGNVTCSEPWKSRDVLLTVEFIVPIVILILFNLVVISGNILVIIAVFSHTKLRTVTNTFIVSLALADLLLGVTILPFSAANEVLRFWPFGKIWCNVWLAMDVWVCTASILNLCAISLDRYLAISRPFKYPRLMSHTRARILVASVWVASFLICFPPLIGWKEPSNSTSREKSTSQDPNDALNGTTLLTFSEDNLLYIDQGVNHTTVDYVGVDGYDVINLNITQSSTIGQSSSCPKSGSICELTSEPGYIIYSALGSFWIPVWIMVFFYWRIYRAAAKTTSAIRTGVLTTKTSGMHSNSENAVTLRIHRGGGSSTRNNKSPTEESTSNKLLNPQYSPKLRRPSAKTEYCNRSPTQRRSYDNGSRQHLNGTNKIAERKSSVQCQAKSGIFHKKKCPKIRITFSKSEPNGFREPGARQPLRYPDPNCPEPKEPRRVHLVQNGSQVQSIEESCMAMEDSTSNEGRNSLGFVNKVSRMQLKTHIKRINKEKKAAKTVGIIVGCFILCWAPFFTVYLLGAFCMQCTPDIVFTIFFWLGYCNSAVNPCLYALCSKDFRYAFKKLLRCRVERRRMERTGTRFVNMFNSIRIQISTHGSDSNSE